MTVSITLKSQIIQNQVREVGINENCWYPVAWAYQLKKKQVIPVKIWHKSIAVYRDLQGYVYALENACPHKGIELHLGEVNDDRIVCPYHGWEFDNEGQCVNIPYFPKEQKLPRACAISYPAVERYGIIWVFPGERELASVYHIPEVPEYSDPNCLVVPITGIFQAHFSICNENAMDVFHGFLHNNLQGWFDPVLLELKDGDDFVKASYRVSYKGFLSRFIGIANDEQGVSTRIVSIHYQYPHYHTTLEGVSSLYLMRLPVGPNQTRSFSLLFLPKVRLPKWLLRLAGAVMVPIVRRLLFMPFLEQDIGMMESEQRTYDDNKERRYVEVNPAIIALQRVTVRQYEIFKQKSNPSKSQQNIN
jgi:renierapurpurin 18,18'-hydroxylase